jgi:hypothetical protein
MVKINKVKSTFMALVCLFLFLTSTCFAEGENNSNSVSDISSNVNSLGTRKWGSLYVVFPHFLLNCYYKVCKRKCHNFYEGDNYLYNLVFNFLPCFVIEYKKNLIKKLALCILLNFNDTRLIYNHKKDDTKDKDIYYSFSVDLSLEYVYCGNNNYSISLSFSPIGLCLPHDESGSYKYKQKCKQRVRNETMNKHIIKDVTYLIYTLDYFFKFGFTLFKFEDKNLGYYINYLKFEFPYACFCCRKNTCDSIVMIITQSLLSFEFGFNICRLIDKKKVKTSEL